MDLNDTILVKKIKSGDISAFDQIYHKYSKRIYAFAISYLKNEAEVEELVQDVFKTMWIKREELNENYSFNSFIFTMTKNAVLNIIRRRDFSKSYMEYRKSFPDRPKNLVDEEINYNELQAALEKAIESLPERRKLIFTLSRNENLSNKEIANKLNISVKTVENQMTSALNHLRKHLKSYGIMGILFYYLFI